MTENTQMRRRGVEESIGEVLPLLRRQASRILDQDAEDAVQVTCLKLFKYSQSWLSHPNPQAYAVRAVITACYDMSRNGVQDALMGEIPDRPHPRDPLADREAWWEMERLLSTASRKQAAAVYLVDVQGYSIDGAAELLGVHRGTVSRARLGGLRAMRTAVLAARTGAERAVRKISATGSYIRKPTEVDSVEGKRGGGRKEPVGSGPRNASSSMVTRSFGEVGGNAANRWPSHR
ncbi:RNA polymerase sigma factor [Streptomyces sp. NPDC047130]|uniref:RNA polymerase sigma factor n=1 Tax=Streptomyces sp. NPDC047130 TaxID=3155261 RepID=UPI0034072828